MIAPEEAPSGIIRFAPAATDTDLRAVARAALKNLDERLNTALPKTEDPMTQAHLEDSPQEIDEALHPRK